MEQRKVFLLDPPGRATSVEQFLVQRGWSIIRVDFTRPFELPEIPAPAGLLVLDRETLSRCRETIDEILFQTASTEWIALIPSSCLDIPGIHRILIELAHDYHTLPADLERLSVILGHAHGMGILRGRTTTLELASWATPAPMLGNSPEILRIFRQIEYLSGESCPVFITGEKGVGKHTVARTIHYSSSRRNGPFVVIEYEPNLFREMFDAEGPRLRLKSNRELSVPRTHGTVYLHSAGQIWPKLLRLQPRATVQMVDSSAGSSTDMRLIASAEDDNLENQHTSAGGVHLALPPLRRRPSDIELLAKFYLRKFSREGLGTARGLSDASLEVLKSYHWPENVQELVNRVRNAVMMVKGKYISPTDLGLERRTSGRRLISLAGARADAEVAAIRSSLGRNRRNITAAARDLGISRITLYRLMEKYGICARLVT